MPRPSSDAGLATNLQEMKLILQSLSDEYFLNMKETTTQKRDILLLNVYYDLNFLFQFVDTSRIADTSLRMAQITLSNGLCCMSPLAFAEISLVFVNMRDNAENITLGYRVGTIALRLLNKIDAIRYTSAVIAIVGGLISWVAEPLQSIAESHLLGYDYGQRNGDIVSGRLNYQFYVLINFVSGQNLADCRDKSREFAHELLRCKQQFILRGTWTIYLQAVAFIEGIDVNAEEEDGSNKLFTWDNITDGAHQDFLVGKYLMVVVHNL